MSSPIRRAAVLACSAALATAAVTLQPATPAIAQSSTTYVDCSQSSPGNGTQTNPYNTLEALDHAFGPAKSVLLKRGTTCTGTIVINASGTAATPTVLGAYGEGPAPVIDAQGSATNQHSGIEVDNESHLVIQDLTVKNGYFSNVSIEAHNGATMEGITVRRVTVEENAWKGGPNDVTKNFWVMGVGGVIIMPCSASSSIKNILVDQVDASNQHYAGVQVGYHQLYPWSDYEQGIARDGYEVPTCFDTESPKYPLVSPKTGIQHAIISNSTLHDNDAMGAGIFGATDVVLRGNALYRNGSGVNNPTNTMNGTGAWWDTTKDVVAEWNNAWGNRVGWTGNDGTGLDADRNTENSIIQHNYLHDNGGYGASLIAAYGDASVTMRYNLIVNNGTYRPNSSPDIMVSTYASRTEDGKLVTGQTSGLWIYGNTIHRDPGRGNAPGIRLQSRYSKDAPIAIVNNIIDRPSSGGIYSFNAADAAQVNVVRNNFISSPSSPSYDGDRVGVITYGTTAVDGMQWPTSGAFRLAQGSVGEDLAVAYDSTTLPGATSTDGLVDFWGVSVPRDSGFAVGAIVSAVNDYQPQYAGEPPVVKVGDPTGVIARVSYTGTAPQDGVATYRLKQDWVPPKGWTVDVDPKSGTVTVKVDASGLIGATNKPLEVPITITYNDGAATDAVTVKFLLGTADDSVPNTMAPEDDDDGGAIKPDKNETTDPEEPNSARLMTDSFNPNYRAHSGNPGTTTKIAMPSFDDPTTHDTIEKNPAPKGTIFTPGNPTQPGVTVNSTTGEISVEIPKDAKPGTTITIPVIVTYPDESKDETAVTLTVNNRLAHDRNTAGVDGSGTHPTGEDIPEGATITESKPNSHDSVESTITKRPALLPSTGASRPIGAVGLIGILIGLTILTRRRNNEVS